MSVELETISPKDFGREWLERESATVFDGSNPPQAKSTRTRRRRETSPDTNANSTTDPGVFHGVKRRPFLLGPKGLTIPTASRPLDEKSLIRVLRQNPTTKQQPVAPWSELVMLSKLRRHLTSRCINADRRDYALG